MFELQIHIERKAPARSALSAAPLMVLLLVAPAPAVRPVQQAAAAPSLSGASGRRYYQTATQVAPSQAAAACGEGYQMASVWEILDPSAMRYVCDHADALTREDSGCGPPSGSGGWVRTGYASSASSVAGRGNCLAWTSTDGADYGTAVALANSWETTPPDLGPWYADAFPCSFTGPVWCVGDVYGIYLPLIQRL